MREIRWVIQDNLIAENDLKQLQEGCKDIGVEFQEVQVIPFSSELPEFTIDNKLNIYYGSTTFMNNLYIQLDKPEGLFYNHETFTMLNYLKQWGDYMLSSEGQITSIGTFINNPELFRFDMESNIFIRPNGDGKEFDGQVGTYEELVPMLERMMAYDSPLDIESSILVGPAYNIHKEWRNYIVNGKIVSSSLYRKNFKLNKSSLDIPEEMLTFVKERIKEYQPHESFAMDIASTEDGTYYIIECGCLNSVGFYHANIKEIVKVITEWKTGILEKRI